jgi:hypothetical protein
MDTPNQNHAFRSVHREMILEYRFLSDVLQFIWSHDPEAESPIVMRSDVDDGGFDLIVEWRGCLRHIQLKSTVGRPSHIRVSKTLCSKPAGCVILMFCSNDLSQVSYSWLGPAGRGERLTLPDKPAKHVRADSTGTKRESISAVKVPLTLFKPLDGPGALVATLFPPEGH